MVIAILFRAEWEPFVRHWVGMIKATTQLVDAYRVHCRVHCLGGVRETGEFRARAQSPGVSRHSIQ